jgi:hypothetical protein
MFSLNKFKKLSLTLAESIDAWRIVPRIILIAYGYLVWSLYMWYKSIPVYPQMHCDSAVLQVIMEKGIKFAQAADIACSYAGTVGGPTTEQTMFVTTIVGLSTGIFALYATTGRKWSKNDNDYDSNSFNSANVDQPCPPQNPSYQYTPPDQR